MIQSLCALLHTTPQTLYLILVGLAAGVGIGWELASLKARRYRIIQALIREGKARRSEMNLREF